MKSSRKSTSEKPTHKRTKSATAGREVDISEPTSLPRDSAAGWELAIDALTALTRCELPPASELVKFPPAQTDAISAQYAELGASLLHVLGSAFQLHSDIEQAQMPTAESANGMPTLAPPIFLLGIRSLKSEGVSNPSRCVSQRFVSSCMNLSGSAQLKSSRSHG